MNIFGREKNPWDALFIFHFLSDEEDHAVAERLQKLIVRQASIGLKPGVQIEAGKAGSPCRILGRFIAQKECTTLISAWNASDGEMAWMCWMPNHGIATVTDGQLDWWALICFQCASARISGPLSQSNHTSRLLPEGTALRTELDSLLPERPFPITQ